MENTNPPSSPIPMTIRLLDKDSLSIEEERKQKGKVPYALSVGSIMYVLRYKLNIGRIGCARREPVRKPGAKPVHNKRPDRCGNWEAPNRYYAREYIWELV